MNIIKHLALLLLILAASRAQTDTQDIENQSRRVEAELSDIFTFEQQCPIQQADIKDNSAMSAAITIMSASIGWIIQRVLIGMPWVFFMYSIGCSMLLTQYYQKGWSCFPYTIVSLTKLIHNGALYMFYCQYYKQQQAQGTMFFYSIMITCSSQIARIVLSQKISQTEKRIFAAFMSFIILAIMCFKEYYNTITQCICFSTHIMQLSFAVRNKTSNKFNVPLDSINLLINSVTFFFVPICSQVYFHESASAQKLFYAAYSSILAFSSFLIIYPPVRKQFTTAILRFYYVSILKRFGIKQQTDTCSICWQDMELFLGVEEIQSFYQVHGAALIRVHRNHIFHKRCLSLWILTKNTCPLDNEQIEAIR